MSPLREITHLRTPPGIGEQHTHQFGQVLGFIFLTGYGISCKQWDKIGVVFFTGVMSVPLSGNAALWPRRSFICHQGKKAEVRKNNRHGKKYRKSIWLNWQSFIAFIFLPFYSLFLKVLPKTFKALLLKSALEAVFQKVSVSYSICYAFMYIPLNRWFWSSWDRWWMLCFIYTNKIFSTGE